MSGEQLPVVTGSFGGGNASWLSNLTAFLKARSKVQLISLSAVVLLILVGVPFTVVKYHHDAKPGAGQAQLRIKQRISQAAVSADNAKTPAPSSATSQSASKSAAATGKTSSSPVKSAASSSTSSSTSSGGSSSGASSGSGSQTGGSSGVSGFQSVLYWLAWDGGNESAIPWNAVTQVDLFSLATCTGAGTPEPDCTGPSSIDTQLNSVNSVNVASFVNTVHQQSRLAIITIGGSTNPNWEYPCSSANVAAFAQNLVNYMKTNGFDGVDLDIEQDTPTGSPQFTATDLQACAADVYNDAKAIKTSAGNTPLVTSDVDPTTDYDIGQIEKPYIDQFNAMSYGAKGATLASQIQSLETQSGIPASKITAGLDVDDYPPPQTDCAGTASYASSNGLMGTMLWFGQSSYASACLGAIAPYL